MTQFRPSRKLWQKGAYAALSIFCGSFWLDPVSSTSTGTVRARGAAPSGRRVERARRADDWRIHKLLNLPATASRAAPWPRTTSSGVSAQMHDRESRSGPPDVGGLDGRWRRAPAVDHLDGASGLRATQRSGTPIPGLWAVSFNLIQ